VISKQRTAELGSTNRRAFLKGLGCLGLAGVVFLAAEPLTLRALATIGPTPATLAVRKRPTLTYVVQQVGGTVQAAPIQAGSPSTISDQDAANVISKALAVADAVWIRAGTYTITRKIAVRRSNVELYGDSNSSTILRLGDNVLQNVLAFEKVSNCYIHDLQIDGNRQNQPYTPPVPKYAGPVIINGVGFWSSTNCVISNCYVHDVRSSGISLELSSNCTVSNCLVQRSDANGITVSNQAGGSGNAVIGNTVDGASDVGITGWHAVDYTVANNIVRNVNMNTSPFLQNTHIGIMAEGGSGGPGCSGVVYRNNIIENCSGSGLYCSPAADGVTNKNVILDGNTIRNCGRGLCINRTDTISVTKNTFDTTTDPNGFGLLVDTNVNRADIEGNTWKGIAASPIIKLRAPNGIFQQNMIQSGGQLAQSSRTTVC
jgi:parallel beta-helix repeat protein